MDQDPETAPRETVAPLLPASAGLTETTLAWDDQPPLLTTRAVATLFGKSPGNIRARASKGDFGPTQSGPDGLPRYDRERVRAVYERMAARQARSATGSAPALAPPAFALPPPVAALLSALQAQHAEHSSLCTAWLDEAREAARQAKAEAQELREVLRQREETMRGTLTHMDMLHNQNIVQMREGLAAERASWERERDAKDAEIERLKASGAPEKSRALWRK